MRAASVAAALLIAQQVAGKATRDAFYLSQFSVTTLPVMSVVSALLSLAAVGGFARAMGAFSPARVVPLALGASASLLVACWAVSLSSPRVAAVVLYLQMAVFGATLVSGFWSVVNERFDPYSARRSMGKVGTGASVGAVAGGLLAWRAAHVVRVPTMLLALAALSALGALAVGLLGKALPARTEGVLRPAERPGEAAEASGWRLVRSVPYLRDLALLIAACAFLEALLDYAFSAAAVGRLGGGGSLMGFFALFQTTSGLLTLVLQAGLARPCLEALGLAGTVGVLPAVVGLSSAAVLAFPRFWPLVFLRGAETVVRNSLFRSGYELLYTPIPAARKRPAKAIVDVAFDRAGTIAGSLAVMGMLTLASPAPIRLLAGATALASLLMAVLAARFHPAYVSALVESLKKGVVRVEAAELLDSTTRGALESVAAGAPPSITGTAASIREAASASADALVRKLSELRAGDPARVRSILSTETPGPAVVAVALPLLARDDLFAVVLAALRRAAPLCTGQLVDALLDPALEPVVRRRVARVLVAAPNQRAADGLVLALRDERFDVRYRAAQALRRLREANPRLSVPAPEAFDVALREIRTGRNTRRDLDHVFVLLSLALAGEPLEIALRALRAGDLPLRGTALEYLDNVLPGQIREALWPRLGAAPAAARSGRPADEIRDELLRSSTHWSSPPVPRGGKAS